jgi:hypothetical protein
VTGDTEGTVTDGTAIDASESVDGTDVERQHGDDAVSKNEMSADGYGNVSSVAEDDPVSNNTERTESDDDATQNTTVERTAMDSNGTDDTATDATGTDGTTGDSESTDSDDGGASDPRVAPTDESADTEQSEQKRDDSNASVAGSDAIGEEVPDGGTVSTAGGTEAVVEIYADSGTA